MSLRISNLRLSIDAAEADLPQSLARAVGVSMADVRGYRILRKALDLRDKRNLRFVYTAELSLPPDAEAAARTRTHSTAQIESFTDPPFTMPDPGIAPLRHRPVI